MIRNQENSAVQCRHDQTPPQQTPKYLRSPLLKLAPCPKRLFPSETTKETEGSIKEETPFSKLCHALSPLIDPATRMKQL